MKGQMWTIVLYVMDYWPIWQHQAFLGNKRDVGTSYTHTWIEFKDFLCQDDANKSLHDHRDQ